MAKRTSSTHTHVPTHIGLTIIAVVALVFSALLITQYDSNNQTQTIQSHAATAVRRPTPACTWHNVCLQVRYTGNHYYCAKYGKKCY